MTPDRPGGVKKPINYYNQIAVSGTWRGASATHWVSGCSSRLKAKCHIWLPHAVLCRHWVSIAGNKETSWSAARALTRSGCHQTVSPGKISGMGVMASWSFPCHSSVMKRVWPGLQPMYNQLELFYLAVFYKIIALYLRFIYVHEILFSCWTVLYDTMSQS
jgi:hypothetical protein